MSMRKSRAFERYVKETNEMTDWPSDVADQHAEAAGDAAALLEHVEEMQNSGNYDWASETLEGIQETVEKTGTVSEAQQRAIDNIEEGGQRGRQRSRGAGW